MMEFSQPLCPICNGIARGTLETVTGIAELNFRKGFGMHASKRADYSGMTDIFWDEQRSIERKGKVVLVCHEGHDWLSARKEVKG